MGEPRTPAELLQVRKKLRSLPLRSLRVVASELEIDYGDRSRNSLSNLISGRLRAIEAPPSDWWGAMRRLRTLEMWGDAEDDEIVEGAEEKSGRGPGTATVEDLNDLFVGLWKRRARVYASVPVELTRSEILKEISKYPVHEGDSLLEIEEKVAYKGETATRKGLANYLYSLGGPSSSGPERSTFTTAEALAELEGHERFRGMERNEILEELSGARSGGLFVCDEAAEGFRRWGKDPPRKWSEPLEDLVEEVRGLPEFEGTSDQTFVDKVEEETGSPASEEDLLRLLGREEEEVVVSPPDDPRWWEAMRKLRTLRRSRGKDDEQVVSRAKTEEGPKVDPFTSRDLLRNFDRARYGGTLSSAAETKNVLTRGEVLSELSKFERYRGKGVPEIEERVPGREGVASTDELKDHLNALGGSSSFEPTSPGGFWNGMRDLRTLEWLGELEDHELVERAVGLGSLRKLFEKERTTRKLLDHALVPRRLTRRELLVELAKMERYEGKDPKDIGRALPPSVFGLRAHLNLLGGPSSSRPLCGSLSPGGTR